MAETGEAERGPDHVSSDGSNSDGRRSVDSYTYDEEDQHSIAPAAADADSDSTSRMDKDEDNSKVNKRLVFYAGPLGSSSSSSTSSSRSSTGDIDEATASSSSSLSVEKFFYDYALGDVSATQDEKSFPLRYWKWPRVVVRGGGGGSGDGDDRTSTASVSIDPQVYEEIQKDDEIRNEPYKVFKLLVNTEKTSNKNNFVNPSAEIQEAILDSIEEAWGTAAAGVIVGTELFSAGPDGLDAMNRIVRRLKIKSPSDQVTVVINYKTPRFDQWTSIWSSSRVDRTATYDDWLCDESSSSMDDKIRLVEYQMNPLQTVRSIVQKFKWKVALMDMKGIVDVKGLDVAHIIACQIMHAKCTDNNSWVKKHGHDNIQDAKSNGSPTTVSTTGLSEQDQELAEDLFRFRDCALKPVFLDMLKGSSTNSNNNNPTPDSTAGPNQHNIVVSPDEFRSIGLSIFHQSALWEDCHPEMEYIYDRVQDPDVIFKSLLSQTECGRTMEISLDIGTVLSGSHGGTNRATHQNGVETWNQVILEAVLYPLILVSAMLYQVCRMYRGSLGQRKYQKISNSDDDLGAEMMQLRSSANRDLDAEYGETNEDEEDGMESAMNGKVARDNDIQADDEDDDEFLDALQSQSSLEIGDAA
mmetsp:Transcript_41355/g.99041  ORF Transcript_41355/g.99041 Transcript_41355/m.99041 type:complete len:638 (+) Transcript_41355:106-2019(+)